MNRPTDLDIILHRIPRQEIVIELSKDCPKCHGTGTVMNYNNKGIHICYDCLNSGKLDQ